MLDSAAFLCENSVGHSLQDVPQIYNNGSSETAEPYKIKESQMGTEGELPKGKRSHPGVFPVTLVQWCK